MTEDPVFCVTKGRGVVDTPQNAESLEKEESPPKKRRLSTTTEEVATATQNAWRSFLPLPSLTHMEEPEKKELVAFLEDRDIFPPSSELDKYKIQINAAPLTGFEVTFVDPEGYILTSKLDVYDSIMNRMECLGINMVEPLFVQARHENVSLVQLNESQVVVIGEFKSDWLQDLMYLGEYCEKILVGETEQRGWVVSGLRVNILKSLYGGNQVESIAEYYARLRLENEAALAVQEALKYKRKRE